MGAHDKQGDPPADGEARARGVTSLHLARAREGDAASLEEVVRRLTPLLLAQARYRLKAVTRRVMDAEDLVADAWLRTLPRLRELSPREGRLTPVVLAYLGTTLRRRARDVLQAQLRRAPPPDAEPVEPVEWLPADTGNVVTKVIQEERNAALSRALTEMKEADREILVLRGLEQAPVREVAAITGLTEDAVKQRYRRALQRLKDRLPGSVLDDLGP